MNLLYLDTETTGLDPILNDIIEIAAIIEVDGVKKEEFDFYVQPLNYESIQPDALAAHHITVEQMRGFEVPFQILKRIDDKLKLYSPQPFIIIGQNPKFDYLMLSSFWKKHANTAVRPFSKVFSYKTLDLTTVAALFHIAGIFNFGNFKLGSIIEPIGISFQGEAHNALVDTKATYEAWQWFINYVRRFNHGAIVNIQVLQNMIPIESPVIAPIVPIPGPDLVIPSPTITPREEYPGLFSGLKNRV